MNDDIRKQFEELHPELINGLEWVDDYYYYTDTDAFTNNSPSIVTARLYDYAAGVADGRKELAANNARLREVQDHLRHALIGVCQDNLPVSVDRMVQINAALDKEEAVQEETPAQSVAHYKAEEIERLTKEIEAANANNALLRGHLANAVAFVTNTEAFGHQAETGILECADARWDMDETKVVLAETPTQSVAHYKADGMRMAAAVCRNRFQEDKYDEAADHWNYAALECAEAIEAKAKEIEDAK